MASLKNTTVNDTGFIQLPTGTDAQRPGSPSAGMVRYNTTQGCIESYNGSAWLQIRNIISNGLIHYIDPSNTSSYSGSGTTVANLVGTGANLSLINGASFSSNNGGILDFTTTNSEGLGVTLQNFSTSAISLCAWVNLDNLSTTICRFITIFGSQEIAVIRKGGQGNGNHLEFYIRTQNGFNYAMAFDFLQLSTWTYIAATWAGSTMRTYQNGVLRGINSSVSGTTLTGLDGAGNANIALSTNSVEFLRGRIGHTAIYNRALSHIEVVQNFNTTRARFGI